MPISNADIKGRYQMPISNADIKCRYQMPISVLSFKDYVALSEESQAGGGLHVDSDKADKADKAEPGLLLNTN
jgi:hypothetical protein